MKYLITAHPDGNRWDTRVVLINVDGTMEIHFTQEFRARKREQSLLKGIKFALAQENCDEIKVIPH